MVGSTGALVPQFERQDSDRNRFLFPVGFMAFLVPFLPSPNSGGLLLIVSPAVVAFCCLWAAVLFSRDGNRLAPASYRESLRIVLIGIVPLIASLARILFEETWVDLPFWTSRLVLVTSGILIAVIVATQRADPVIPYAYFLRGYVLVALLIIVIGVTGISVFGPPAPPRTYGIRLPFYKTTAIPRSFGEFAIMSCAAWAYLLVYRNRFHARRWWGLAAVVVLSVVVAQSRTGFVTFALTSAGWWLFVHKAHPRLARVAFWLVFSWALWISSVASLVLNSHLLSPFIGRGFLLQNVTARFGSIDLARSLIGHGPVEILFEGISRLEWQQTYRNNFSAADGVHNHVLSNWLYFGVVGGSIYLLLFYAWPAMRMIRGIESSKPHQFGFLLLFSSLACLQFYEGFYSAALVLQLGFVWGVILRETSDRANQASESILDHSDRRRPT